jgi:hypothetical protein
MKLKVYSFLHYKMTSFFFWYYRLVQFQVLALQVYSAFDLNRIY